MEEELPSKNESRNAGEVPHFNIYPTSFDPYQHPPSLDIALTHQAATRFANFDITNSEKCPCCQRPSSAEPFTLCCSLKEIAVISPTYAIFFYFQIFGGGLTRFCFSVGLFDELDQFADKLPQH